MKRAQHISLLCSNRAGALLLGFFCFCVLPQHSVAQIEVRSMEIAPAFFGGAERTLPVAVHNCNERASNATFRTRMFQLSSATAMPIDAVTPWKVSVPGGQTILENARVRFPAVRAVTRFDVQWTVEPNTIAGHTIVSVYPTNYLQTLAEAAGGKPFGIFDPQEQISPLLEALNIEFTDLAEDQRLETFRGPLAIVGPVSAAQAQTYALRKRCATMSSNGTAVVLVATVPNEIHLANHPLLLDRQLVIIQPEMLVRFESNPLAQETLVECARLALNPHLAFAHLYP